MVPYSYTHNFTHAIFTSVYLPLMAEIVDMWFRMSLMVKLAPQNSWLCKYTLVLGGNKCQNQFGQDPPPIWTTPKRGGAFSGAASLRISEKRNQIRRHSAGVRGLFIQDMCDMYFFQTFHNYYSEVNFDSNDWLHGEQIGPSCVRDSGEGWCKEVMWRTSWTAWQKASQLFPVNGPLKACGFFSEKWQAWWFFAS